MASTGYGPAIGQVDSVGRPFRFPSRHPPYTRVVETLPEAYGGALSRARSGRESNNRRSY